MELRYYWVVQEIGGSTYFHGPYKTPKGRNSRFKRVVGGEVFRFNSRSEDVGRVKQEYNDARVEKLLDE